MFQKNDLRFLSQAYVSFQSDKTPRATPCAHQVQKCTIMPSVAFCGCSISLIKIQILIEI